MGKKSIEFGANHPKAAVEATVPPRSPVLFGATLKEFRKRAGISQRELGEMLGVTRNTVIYWESDKFKPEHDLLLALCDILGLTLDRLFGVAPLSGGSELEKRLLENFRLLSPVGQRVVDRLTSAMLEEELRDKDERLKDAFALFEVPSTKAAAGSGSSYIQTESDYAFLRKSDQNSRADAIIGVEGDSMLPVYHDGDYVYVEYTRSAHPGEDVICTTSSGGVIKRVTADGKLQSVNPALPFGDRSEDDNVRIIGRVLGVVSSSDRPAQEDMSILEELFSAEIREFRRTHGTLGDS